MRRRNRHRVGGTPGGEVVCDRSRLLYRAWPIACARAKLAHGPFESPEQSPCLVCAAPVSPPRPHGYGKRYCTVPCRRAAENERERLRTRVRRDLAEVTFNMDLDRENGGLYSALYCLDGTPFVAWIASIRARIAANQARIRALGGRVTASPGRVAAHA